MLSTFYPTMMPFWLWPVLIWTLVWKGIALWKCGRNNQLSWFVFILVLNTAGILPIIYILFFRKNKNPRLKKVQPKVVKKKKGNNKSKKRK